MKKINFKAIVTFAALIAPLPAFLLIDGIMESAQRVNALSGQSLFFSLLTAFGLTCIYLLYRLIYTPEHHRSYIEFSASTLLIHFLALSVFSITILGAGDAFPVLGSLPQGNLIGLIIIFSSIMHLAIDFSQYHSRANTPIRKASELTHSIELAPVSTAFILTLFMILLSAAIIPETRELAIVSSGVLLWDLLYLLLARPTITRILA